MRTTSQHRASPADGTPTSTSHRGRIPPPPSPLASDADWQGWRRARRVASPPWAFDADWLTSHALEALPLVMQRLGCGKPVAMLPRPRWWFGPDLPDQAAALHRLGPMPELKPVVALRLTPDTKRHLLFIDQSLGGWDCPNLCRRGDDLVSLAAWRWERTQASAAWLLARTLGLGRPMP